MRVYYDSSVNKSIACDIMCKHSNVDFCNIESINLQPAANFFNFQKTILNFNYLHSMVWRFLPIGDSFVDVFSSRDIDSLIHKREVDATREWLKSNRNIVGHIMRGWIFFIVIF